MYSLNASYIANDRSVRTDERSTISPTKKSIRSEVLLISRLLENKIAFSCALAVNMHFLLRENMFRNPINRDFWGGDTFGITIGLNLENLVSDFYHVRTNPLKDFGMLLC